MRKNRQPLTVIVQYSADTHAPTLQDLQHGQGISILARLLLACVRQQDTKIPAPVEVASQPEQVRKDAS